MVSTKSTKRIKTFPLTPSSIIFKSTNSTPFHSLSFGNPTFYRTVLSLEAQFVERQGSYFQLSSNLSTSEQLPIPSVVFVDFDCSYHPLRIPLQSHLVLRALFALVSSVHGYPSRLFHIWRKKADRAPISGQINSPHRSRQFFRNTDTYSRTFESSLQSLIISKEW